MRLSELVATLSLVSDLGMGRPMERALRQTVIAMRLATAAGVDGDTRAAAYYTSLITWVGCATDTSELAELFGDETELYADTHDDDLAGVTLAMFVARHLGRGSSPLRRAGLVGNMVVTAGRSVKRIMQSHCQAVHQVRLADGHDAWLVLGHAAARQALNHPRVSKDMVAALGDDPDVVAEGLPGPALSRHMLNVDPPDHTRLRRLVARAFLPSRVALLEAAIQQTAGELLDNLETQGLDAVVDLVDGFAHPLPFRVICELLGVPEADRAALRSGRCCGPGPATRRLRRWPRRTRSSATSASSSRPSAGHHEMTW